MSNNSELNKPKNIWTITIDIRKADNILIEGCGASLDKINNETVEVILKGRFYQHRLVEVRNNIITIYSSSASMVPCYARIISGKLHLSNVAENIVVDNETISINTYVLFQNMTGIPYPQNNIFNDIVLCEASAIYTINNENIVYKGSQLETDEVATFDKIFETTKNNFDSYMKDGSNVNVLLSGGYDSRLNLCYALDSAARFGNKINTYHFYKDDNELSISSSVAEKSKISFVCKKKDDYIGEKSRMMVFDENFISFHNGNYRDDLLRWHGLLDEVTTSAGIDSLTIGLGAEAHKGKYYRHFNNVNDAEKVLGINSFIVPEICRALGVKSYNKDSQTSYFNSLIKRSKIYDRLDQQIDFMHYHTYVSNGWGGRFHDIGQYYSVPFPFVEHDFLKMAFSLPKAQKQDFYITRKMIEVLNPDLSEMSYVTGNELSIRHKRKNIKNYIPDVFYKELSYMYKRYFKNRKKGRASLFADELSIILAIEPRSYLTKLLKNILVNKYSDVPHIRLNFTLQSFLYLTFLEKKKNINLVFE